MQSLPSVASGAGIVFIKISAMKALRLDGCELPSFSSCYRMSEVCIVGRNWDFTFSGHILMLAPLSNSPVSDFYAHGKSEKEFQEWSVGLSMKGGANRMSIFRMNVNIFICLKVWERENPLHSLYLPLVWLSGSVYGQNMTEGFSEGKCFMLCVG